MVAGNALLRQQLIILCRQVKRLVWAKTDRMLQVYLVRMVRTWKQLHHVINAYVQYFNRTRLHQRIKQQISEPNILPLC